jgi:ABC-2 type transport system permease protein
MSIYKLKAVIWLHLLRLWRYKYSAVNMALNTTLWVTIFILGALMFMAPEDLPRGVPLAFWGIALWTILSSCVWLIGGWTNFYVSMGFVEEHILVNTSSSRVLVGRAITGLSISTLAIILIYYVLSALIPVTWGLEIHIQLLVLGLLSFIVMALSYGLILSALSFRTGVPGVLLDISNFIVFIIGGIATPVSMLPPPIRNIALVIPYSYPSELVRYGASGIEPYLPIDQVAFIALSISILMGIFSLWLMRWAEAYARKHGVKAIGRM